MELQDGIGLVPLVMGLFGISEVLISLEESGEVTILKENIVTRIELTFGEQISIFDMEVIN